MDTIGAQMEGLVHCTAASMDYNAVGGVSATTVSYMFDGPGLTILLDGLIDEFRVGEFYALSLVIKEPEQKEKDS